MFAELHPYDVTWRAAKQLWSWWSSDCLNIKLGVTSDSWPGTSEKIQKLVSKRLPLPVTKEERHTAWLSCQNIPKSDCLYLKTVYIWKQQRTILSWCWCCHWTKNTKKIYNPCLTTINKDFLDLAMAWKAVDHCQLKLFFQFLNPGSQM